VAAIAGQFAVGWTMDADDAALKGQDERIDQLEELGKEQAKGQGEAAEQVFENEIDRLRDELDARENNYVSDAFSGVFSGDFLAGGLSGPELHVLLGLSIMLLGLLRIVWRARTPCHPGPTTSAPESDGSSPSWRWSCSPCSSWCPAPGCCWSPEPPTGFRCT